MNPETDNWVDLDIIRSLPKSSTLSKTASLIINVRARPEIENFMRGLANDRKLPVDNFADMWDSVNKQILQAYDIQQNFPSHVYTLEAVGLPLLPNYIEVNLGKKEAFNNDTVNLSFLKLVGISEPEGVSIAFNNPYSAQYINKFKALWPAAALQFLRDYVVPITIHLSIVSKK
jgi:hypothetical protein